MSFKALTQLGDISTEEFLSSYWQQRPLLIRNAFTNLPSFISSDELAGFCLEEDIESRLIYSDENQTQWHLENGPLEEERFNHLPKSHWTILVQGVDTLIPEVAELLNAFRFIPNWRLDDIMVSYAADQGSVGPHFDFYDVFLLQVEGKREWRIGQQCNEHTALLPDCELSLLKTFNQTDAWVLEPGDMLYLPPKLAHWGIAQGDCITYSVGFRAPKTSELLSNYADFLLQHLQEDSNYVDISTKESLNNGSLTVNPMEIKHMQSQLAAIVNDEKLFANWFGQYMTQTRYPDFFADEDSPEDDLIKEFSWSPGARYIVIISEAHSFLYVNGDKYPCSNFLKASMEKNQGQFTIESYQALTPADKETLNELQRNGLIYPNSGNAHE